MAINNSNVMYGNFRKGDNSGSGGHNDGGDGSGGGGMEERLRHLEQEMVSAKVSLQHIEQALDKSVASKADLFEFKAEMHSLLRQQIMWSVGSVIGAAGLVFAIMRFSGA